MPKKTEIEKKDEKKEKNEKTPVVLVKTGGKSEEEVKKSIGSALDALDH